MIATQYNVDDSAEIIGVVGEEDHNYCAALITGGYNLVGGLSGEDEKAYIHHECPNCGCTVSSNIITDRDAFIMTCEECNYNIATVTNHREQLKIKNYDNLKISDIESFKHAIYLSAMISVAGTYNFMFKYITSDRERVSYLERYFSFLNRELAVSLFRNGNSFTKVMTTLADLRTEEATKNYNIGLGCLLSNKNLENFMCKIKVRNINILTDTDVGITDKMMYITTSVFPIFLPLELFEEEYLEMLCNLKGTKLKIMEKTESEEEGSFKILPKFTGTRSLIRVDDINNIQEEVRCKACGNFLSKKDIKDKMCNHCGTNVLFKTKARKKEATSEAS